LGDEEGAGEAAREAGAEQLADLARTDRGTPPLDSAFAAGDRAARPPLRCFVNADVILFDDLLTATRRVAEQAERFLVVGQTIDVEAPRDRDDAGARGRRRGAAAAHYFRLP